VHLKKATKINITMMKINRLIIITLLISVVSCVRQKTKIIENQTAKTDSVISKSEITIDKEMTINNKKIDWTKFDKVYAHLDPENELKQILGVKWHGIDSIDYQFVCSTMLCDMEIYGKAKANHPGGDSEIDEDEDGGYPVDEFLFETSDYVVSVRIDSENKSKARLIYTPNGEADECDPDNNLIMKIINAR
jgi:hypothetical protein